MFVQTALFPADLRDRWKVWLPPLFEAVLMLALAIQAARLFWLVVVPPAPFGPSGPASTAAASPLATLSGSDPFSRRDPAATRADASGVQLYGVRGTRGPDGSAILASNDGVQAAYVVGDQVQPGITLASVAADHVVLEVAGARRRLGFATNAGQPAPAAAPSDLPSALPAAASAPAGIDPEQLLAQAGLRPSLEGERVIGYSVIPRGDGGVLRQAGLQADDVLLSVNGQALTPERYRSLAEDLRDAGQLTLTYRRDGETRTTTVQVKRP